MATEKKEPKKNISDSNTLYPLMMRQSKLLVMDYDVTRYHSFDLFRLLLLDKSMFMKIDPNLLPFVKERDAGKQVFFYSRNAKSLSPYDNFTHTKDLVNLEKYEERLQTLFTDEQAMITRTDVSDQFDAVFQRSDITGYLLRYKKDPHKPTFIDKVKTYEVDRMLDLRMAAAIIIKENINAVMLSSVDLAVLLSERLVEFEYMTPVTFIIGLYFYNFNPITNMLKHVAELTTFEHKLNYEFGVFDPFSSLTYRFRMEKLLEEEDNNNKTEEEDQDGEE